MSIAMYIGQNVIHNVFGHYISTDISIKVAFAYFLMDITRSDCILKCDVLKRTRKDSFMGGHTWAADAPLSSYVPEINYAHMKTTS